MEVLQKTSLLAVSIGSVMSFAAYQANQSEQLHSPSVDSESQVITKKSSVIPDTQVNSQTNGIHSESMSYLDTESKSHIKPKNNQSSITNSTTVSPTPSERSHQSFNYTGSNHQAQAYQLGAGIADITGEVAEANMFGYADSDQISSGIQQRLHARAFVIGDASKEVLMVVLDTGMVSQAMHQELLQRLQAKYGNRFNEKNIIITATHTHSAPGGYSHYLLYGLTTRGFQEATFDALVRGSMRAIDRAVSSQSSGTLEFGTTQLSNSSVQRSHTAYVNNPDADDNPTETDTLMQVLKFVKNGEDIASVNWFAVHPTSLTSNNTLVSADNKGYAAWYWETQKGMNYLTGEGYIAAFANSNPGDISPNLNLKPGSGPTEDEWQNAKILGQRQANAAMNTATPLPVTGSIDYRQKYVDFSRQYVEANYTVDGQPHETCPAAYKTAFAGGSTEDGGGGDDLVASGMVNEGVDNPLIQAIGYSLFWPSKDLIACHETDQVAIAMGTTKPTPMSPEVLPNQLIRVGNLAIISVPSEFTTIAGQRIRKQVAERFDLPYENVIFAGYSNAYAGYITTPEEYAQQDYEGASTHFGPHTQEAWLQSVDSLAKAMVNNEPVISEITPRDLSTKQLSLVTGVVFDNKPFRVDFGDLVTQPSTYYQRGEQASAVFWSAHPKSTLAYERELDELGVRETEPYTMAIQKKQMAEYGEEWVTVATDNDWNTTNQWKRVRAAQSHATLTWDIPEDTESGEYRFYHRSAYKNGWTGRLIAFSGVSNTFTIE